MEVDLEHVLDDAVQRPTVLVLVRELIVVLTGDLDADEDADEGDRELLDVRMGLEQALAPGAVRSI